MEASGKRTKGKDSKGTAVSLKGQGNGLDNDIKVKWNRKFKDDVNWYFSRWKNTHQKKNKKNVEPQHQRAADEPYNGYILKSRAIYIDKHTLAYVCVHIYV